MKTLKKNKFIQKLFFSLNLTLLTTALILNQNNLATAQTTPPPPNGEEQTFVEPNLANTQIVEKIIDQFKKVVKQEKTDSYNNSVIVKFTADTTQPQIDCFTQQNNLNTIDKVNEHHFGIFTVTDSLLTVAQLEELNSFKIVIYAEPNYTIAVPETKPDPRESAKKSLFSQQWGLKNQQNLGKDINIAPAWEITKGEGTVVAVLDTGVDATHPDLKDAVITPKGNNDPNGHGTSVASIIAARNNNNQGIVGVAPQAQIIGITVVSKEGRFFISDVVKAILYLTSTKIDIVNLSAGISANNMHGRALQDAFIAAEKAGIIFVTSSGNHENNIDKTPQYPAVWSKELSNIITVSAIDKTGSLANFANYGFQSVNLSAPGVDILNAQQGGGYTSQTGTSFAAPFVTGVVALIKSVNHSYNPQQVRDVLEQNVTKHDSLKNKTKTGGFVNAGKAVAAAKFAEFTGKRVSLRTMLDRRKAVDVNFSNNATLWDSHETANQTFKIVHDKDKKGHYLLQVANNGKYLTWDYASANVAVKDLGEKYTNFQHWKFEIQKDGYFVIYNTAGKNAVLDLESFSLKNGTNMRVANKSPNTNSKTQKWSITTIGGILENNSTYQIETSLDRQSVIDAKGFHPKKSANVQIYDKNNGNNQKWIALYDKHTAAYRFRSAAVANNLYLAWNSNENNNVIISEGNFYNQYWIPERMHNGYYMLANFQDQDKVLDLAGSDTSNEANISLNDKQGSRNQQWNFTKQ